jgi:hypothetical protein
MERERWLQALVSEILAPVRTFRLQADWEGWMPHLPDSTLLANSEEKLH